MSAHSLARKLPITKMPFKQWLSVVSNSKFILQSISEFAVLDNVYQLNCRSKINWLQRLEY